MRHHEIQEGLRAIPTHWIPSGSSRGTVCSAQGLDGAQTERGLSQLFIDTDRMFWPDLTVTDYGDGLVKVALEMPGPVPNISMLGRLRRERDRLVFSELEGLGRSAELYRRDDGALVAVLRRPGQSDDEVVYEHISRCRPGQLRPAI